MGSEGCKTAAEALVGMFVDAIQVIVIHNLKQCKIIAAAVNYGTDFAVTVPWTWTWTQHTLQLEFLLSTLASSGSSYSKSTPSSGMEDYTAAQNQIPSTSPPASPSATDASSHSEGESTNANDSVIADSIHDIPSGPSASHEDTKPSLSQGRAIAVDVNVEAEAQSSELLTPTQHANPSEQHNNLREGPRSSSTLPPTPPSKSTISVLPESADNYEVAPPTPVEKSAPKQTNGQHDPRPQTPSTPMSANSHKRSLTISKGHTVSVVLISSALETILSSREAKRSAELRDSAQHALEMVRSGEGGDRPREIFEPLRLACETRSEKLMIASLDCISKLISYSFFAEPHSIHSLPSPPPSPGPHTPGAPPTHAPTPSLVDLVAHTITACHTETTPETVSLQIVKALLSLVLSPTILVHQSSLLKAVRTVYNVFLLSSDPVNQMVAQGGLTQMVHHVFTRCKASTTAEPSDTTSVFRASATEESILAASRRGSFTPSDGASPEARTAKHREVEAVLNTMNESTLSLPGPEASVPNGVHHDERTSEESSARPTL